MSDNKVMLWVIGIGLLFIVSVAMFLFVVIPKDALVQGRVESKVSSFRVEVNKCYEANGAAYIAEDKIFCKPQGKL